MESYIKIAICDDEIYMLSNIIKSVECILNKYGYKGNIEDFTDGNVLLHKILDNNQYYDIYLLDIDMDGIDGIKLAKRIKEIQEEAIIIFLTSYDKWIFDAFDIQAFNYILKSKINEKLEMVIKKCFTYLSQNRLLHSFKQGKNLISIPYKHILYFESQKRKVKVVSRKNEYYYYDTISDIEKRLPESLFIRVHTSFLVNMEYIRNFDGKLVNLDNGLIIPVSQKYIYSFNMGFLGFLKRKC